MQHRPIYLILFGAVLLASCGLFGSEEEEPEISPSYFAALLNGEPWRGEASGTINEEDRFTIGATHHDSLSYWNESLSFSLYFEGEGTYPLTRHGGDDFYGALHFEADGDAGLATYDPTEDEANQMTLTRYDSAAGLVEGTFAVTLVVDPDDREPKEPLPGLPPFPQRRRPDTLRFTEGHFYVEISDRRDKQP